ncbi:membrane dipeptidase (peptidase family M19) [Oxobacter pfennigii]|uniref:Membrane dipeptidase (Peptidase family M19) n=1 Tax=Oxobacter pfennigii TaxID=36849 RepID=A0A0P8X4L2_9CLOT|nr:dipeptidase [Oxobacter pfennigii]KPU45718.1 membrane dipeptidase (peptidase family M19) [Oxobacter pfennigii]
MKIIDFHCDTILELTDRADCGNLRNNILSIDIEKMKRSNYKAQFFAMFVNLEEVEDSLERALSMIDKFYLELEENKDYISIATSHDEFAANEREGKMSAFLTIEEGGAIKGKLENLRNFYRLGVRLITLTWNYPNEIGYPNHGYTYKDKGLTSFGGEVVAEMNRLGMIIDVSHLSDEGFYDVARLSKKPFIASHSNARAVWEHTRNLTDDMIKILAQKGGVTGINFANVFLGDSKVSRVEDMVKHIKHIKNTGGIGVVSLGTDFDGIERSLEIDNAGEMDKLITGLKKESFTEDEIDKILYKNALRVIKDVL